MSVASPQPTTGPIPWVNEQRILQHVMPKMFQTGWPVIAELVQNAYRAQPTHIKLCWSLSDQDPYDGRTGSQDRYVARDQAVRSLAIEDNGPGVANDDALIDFLTVGSSGFAQDWAHVRPAGMGFYSLLAQAGEIELASGFGRLVLDGPRWLTDGAYRATLLERIDRTGARTPGLQVQARRCTGLPSVQALNERIERLCMYLRRGQAGTLAIDINDQPLRPIDLHDFFTHCLDVGGVRVWFGPSYDYYEGYSRAYAPPHRQPLFNRWSLSKRGHHHQPHALVWYGHVVENTVEGAFNCKTLVEVYDPSAAEVHGVVPEPKLPDRDVLVNPQAMDTFLESERVQQALQAHYRALPPSFFLDRPQEVFLWRALHEASWRAHCPVAVLYAPEEARHNEYSDPPTWELPGVQTVVSLEEKTYLITNGRDDLSYYDLTSKVPLVTPDGAPITLDEGGPRSKDFYTTLVDDQGQDHPTLAVFLGGGNEGVFVNAVLGSPDFGEDDPVDLYCRMLTEDRPHPDGVPHDHANLLEPYDRRLVVPGTPRALPDGHVLLPEGAVLEIAWEDGRRVCLPIEHTVMRRPRYDFSEDELLAEMYIVGPGDPTAILQADGEQAYCYQSASVGGSIDKQRDHAVQEIERLIAVLSGQVPLLRAMADSYELYSLLPNPYALRYMEVIPRPDGDGSDLVLQVQVREEYEAERMTRTWQAGGAQVERTGALLTIQAQVC